uniref:Brevinin-1ITa n=1 Tax=Rana italica TaxID=147302 RepID=BR1A_RANIT|nr:RecName: Full=Brevinin-1ITa [Rana italica]
IVPFLLGMVPKLVCLITKKC